MSEQETSEDAPLGKEVQFAKDDITLATEDQDDQFEPSGLDRDWKAQLDLAIQEGRPPPLLKFGSEEAADDYRSVFDSLFYPPAQPIVDPRGWTIEFEEDYASHVCFAEERFDKRRKRSEGEARTRDHWEQERAEHILWIYAALTAPVRIVLNNQQPGNHAYLLGYPKNNLARPTQRFYASVKPLSNHRGLFRTAYPITQQRWDNAMRALPNRRGQKHILYELRQRW
jgi:hypothetical protein